MGRYVHGLSLGRSVYSRASVAGNGLGRDEDAKLF